MITIKKQHSNFDNQLMINQFSSVVRFAYNRRKKDNVNSQSELEKVVKSSMNNIHELDASLIKCAVKKAIDLPIDEKVYFGGKSNFFKSKYHKKNSYKENKNFPLEIRGSSSDKGNRKATLCIEENKIIFKPKKGLSYDIPLHLSKKEKEMLFSLQNDCKEKKSFFNLKISEKFIWITFDETKIECYKKERVIKKDRVLGIDLNPNYIAISICDFKGETKIIYKEIISLIRLNKLRNKNKSEYELSIIRDRILNLAKHYCVDIVSLEDLNIKTKNHNKGKAYNRLVNNSWNRNYFVNNMVKWMNLLGIRYYKVRPEYSSFIGQMMYENECDSVAASIEIGKRGYNKGKGINEYEGSINLECMGRVSTRWKKMVNDNCCTFRDLYNIFKEKKLKDSYRFLFDPKGRSCLRLVSYGSIVDLYIN